MALHLQHAVVHPVVGQRLPGDGLGLQDLVLVVREDQVVAAAVDVDLLAQVAVDHGGALDVPSRPALPPGRVPGDLAGLGRLPHGEVQGVPLVGVRRDPSGGLHLLGGAVGEPALAAHLGDVEVDAAVLGGVGVAVVDDPLHHGYDVADALAGLGVDVGAVDAQPGGVLEVLLDVPGGELQGLHALLRRAGDDLVVHVGEVGDVGDLVAGVPEVPGDHVEYDHAPCVPHVDVVVDGDAADVHPDLSGLDGLELLRGGREGVVDPE